MDDQRAPGRGDPRLPSGLVDRPALRRILDGGAALTILSGPAGSGKSTLLAQWAAARGGSESATLQATFGVRITNAHTLWRTLLTRLAAADGAVADGAALGDDIRGYESLRDVDAVVRQWFADLAVPCVAIIDDVGGAELMPLLNEIVSILRGAPRLRVVLATRRSLTPHLLQVVADVDTALIGPGQLMFSEVESRAVIEGITGQSAPPGSVESGGSLPLTTRLTALAVLARQWPLSEVGHARATIAEALLSRLISEDIAPDFREFLLRTALPSIVTPEVAALLGCEGDAGEHLDRAEKLGLGMWEAAEDLVGFVYTPLLREALRRQLARRPAGEVDALHRIVALWAFERRLPLEALSHALDANDHLLASRFARTSWFVLSQTYPDESVELLRRQGPVVLSRYPVLTTAMALILVAMGRRLRAFAYFRTAEMRLGLRRDHDTDPIERIWTASVRCVTARYAGHFDRAESSADDVHAVYAKMSARERAEIEPSVSLLLWSVGASYLYGGRTSDAIHALESGMQTQAPDDDGGWYYCASTLAGIHAVQGRFNLARRVLQAIDAADPTPAWRTDQYGFLEQVARAHLDLAALDVAAAQRRLDSIVYHLDTSEHWPFFIRAQAELHLLAGRRHEAVQTIEAALDPGAFSATSRAGMDHLRVLLTLAQLACGDRAGAERTRARISPAGGTARALGGLQATLTGQHDRAFALLGAIGAGDETVSDRQLQILALVSFALSALRLERHTPAAHALARAVAIMTDEQTIAPLRWLSTRDIAELGAAAEGAAAAGWSRLVARLPAGDALAVPLPAPVELTSRERAVLRELERTASTAAIAAALFVSPNTVKVQRRSLYRKLGAADRAEALLRAAERGLLADDPSLRGEGGAPWSGGGDPTVHPGSR